MIDRTHTSCASLAMSLVISAACGSGSEPKTGGGTQTPQAASTALATPNPAEEPAPDPRTAAVRRALEEGLEVDKADELGRTPLMMAAFEGYSDIVSVFLEYGADVDRLDSSGRTALMYAASGPFPATVDLLLRHGSNPNLKDTVESWTALMFAAGEGNTSVVETLLRHGADPTLQDDDGDTALDHARQRNHQDVVDLLDFAGE